MKLEITHGPVRRGRRHVLDAGEVALELPGALAIVGINGSGKSSLFMQLADTLASRGSASVRIDGRPATLAWVPQTPALPHWLRPEDTARMYGMSFDTLLRDMPGLYLDELRGRRFGSLSLGQQQALAIAVALGRNAPVTMLDEPFSALDFRRRRGALDLLRERRDAGDAIVLSSQAASDLLEICDRFLVLRDGRHIFDGTREDLAAGGDDRRIEQRLLELLTMPAPAMEVPSRGR